MRGTQFIALGWLCALLAWPPCLPADDGPEDASLKQENEALRTEVNMLEVRVRQLQHDLEESRSAMVQAKFQIDAFEHRCKKLQDDLLLVRSGRAVVSSAEDGKTRIEPTKAKLIPTQGKITAIGKDGRLIQISIGMDAGIETGQTLDVFRLATGNGNQRSLYLGTLTLTRVDPTAALGYFNRVTGLEHRPAVGDEVSSDLFSK